MDNEYATGVDFWRDTAAREGTDAAITICGHYIAGRLGQELSRKENQFCRELFAAMFEASVDRTNPMRLVYPHPIEEANNRGERDAYFASRDDNNDCACTIDNAISNSSYKSFHYNLDIAAMTAINLRGFQRVSAVLAHCIQASEWDGRYSAANKQWAQGFGLSEKAFSGAYLNAHPVLVESFTNHVRKLYDEVGAERFSLPGLPESGEIVGGYEITRAIVFDDNTGFALARHPEAGYVCWKIITDNGKRDYHLGFYCEDMQAANDRYIARVAAHMSDSGVREAPSRAAPPAPVPDRKPPAPQKTQPAKQTPPPPRPHKKKKDMGAI